MGNSTYSITKYRKHLKPLDRDLWKNLKSWTVCKHPSCLPPPKDELELFMYWYNESKSNLKNMQCLYDPLIAPFVNNPNYYERICQIISTIGSKNLPIVLPYRLLWETEWQGKRSQKVREHYLKVMGHLQLNPKSPPYMTMVKICDACGSDNVSYSQTMNSGVYWDKHFDGFSVHHLDNNYTCNYCGYCRQTTEDVPI